MKTVTRNRKIWSILMGLFLLVSLPVVTSAQGRGRGQEKKLYKFVNGHDARDGRWDGRGPRFGRRNPRSYVTYQRRPYYQSSTYGYPQTYARSQYRTYGSSQPYYTNRYYSDRYSQPHFANRYAYSWANPTYRYNESWYRHGQRRNGLRLRIRSR